MEARLAPAPPPSLEESSWEFISKMAQSGKAEKLWKVGDSKKIIINGKVGTMSFESKEYYVYILGFNHEDSVGIDFGTFKDVDGNDICFTDKKYNSDSTDGTKYFNMYHSGSVRSPSWKNCDLRYDILGSTNIKGENATLTTAINPVAETLMSALPYDLRAVMQPLTIYSWSDGSVVESIDYLPLLAPANIFGDNVAVKNKQYDYFKNGKATTKYAYHKYNRTVYWGLRTTLDSMSFDTITDEGKRSDGGQWTTFGTGIAPIFRV